MSTIIPTATATAAAIITVTASPRPDRFTESIWGTLTIIDVLLVFAGLWTALIVGFTRLSVIPIIVPACAAIGNSILNIEINEFARGLKVFTPGRWAIKNIGWVGEHLIVNFYTYFILTILLSADSPRKLKIYITGFWVLCFGYISASVIDFVAVGIDYLGTANKTVKNIEKNALPPTFILNAALEVWGAVFLLHTLFSGQRIAKQVGIVNFKRAGLLRQLAQSTEIRLASFAIVGIIRTGTGMTWFAGNSPREEIVMQIDQFAVILENLFPVILIIDILAARISPQANAKPQRVEWRDGNLEDQSPGASGPDIKPSAEVTLQTVDSIRRDFGQYLGRRKPSHNVEIVEGLSESYDESSAGGSKIDSKEAKTEKDAGHLV